VSENYTVPCIVDVPQFGDGLDGRNIVPRSHPSRIVLHVLGISLSSNAAKDDLNVYREMISVPTRSISPLALATMSKHSNF
jgi:hypothetical protein